MTALVDYAEHIMIVLRMVRAWLASSWIWVMPLTLLTMIWFCISLMPRELEDMHCFRLEVISEEDFSVYKSNKSWVGKLYLVDPATFPSWEGFPKAQYLNWFIYFIFKCLQESSLRPSYTFSRSVKYMRMTLGFCHLSDQLIAWRSTHLYNLM